jgi:threonine dehydrogenase-like Zn-dependent dehydrogenase
VIGVAATPERRRIAEEMGFDNVCANVEALQRDTPRYADAPETVVIEATGRPDSVLAALRAAPVGARIVLLGSTRGIVSGIDVYSQIHRKAVTVIGAHQMTRPTADPLHGRWAQYQDAGTTLQAILGRRLDFGRLVPTECAVRDVDDAYRTICERPDALCIALRWDAS